MPRKAREILKTRGYTDAELDAFAALADPRFVTALESEDAERERISAEAARMKSDLDATAKWYHEQAVPALNKALGDATQARAERARLEAQIKAEQEYGMRRVADDQQQGQQGQQPSQGQQGNPDARNDNFDPSRYVSAEAFQGTVNQFGDAIAMATDIAEDHRDLFGQRLPGGVTGLRTKYKDAVAQSHFNGTLRDFWESEYKVGDRRTELDKKQQEEFVSKIRQEERQKVMSEYANPATRPLAGGSRNPFTHKAVNGTVSGSGQPWEGGKTVEQRRSERVVKFGTKVLQGNQAG